MEGKFTFQSNQVALFAKDEDKEDKPMRFSVLGYTGGVMESGYGKVAIDLKGMKFRNDITPMFQHHDSTKIVGHADKKTISENGLVLEGVISGTGEAAKEVMETSRNGFPWQASVGVSIQNYRMVDEDEEYEINGETMVGPGIVLSETELFETSFVPLGRDKNTSSALFSEDFEPKLHKEQKMEKEKVEEVIEETQEETVEVSPVSEMKAAFPGDAEFALDALERGLSVIEAKAEFADVVVKQRDELAEELAELQASMSTDVADGEMPVEHMEEDVEQFSADSPEAEVDKLCKKAKAELGLSDSDALRYVFDNNPELADKLI